VAAALTAVAAQAEAGVAVAVAARQITLVLRMDQRQRGGTNDNENYNSIQRGGHDTTINRQKSNMRFRCKIMNWGQDSAFDDIVMDGHTQKTRCHTKTKLQHQ